MSRKFTAGRIRHLALVATLATVVLAIAPPAATAAVTTPLQIQSTSLKQYGRHLVWHLRASHSFYPRRLARNRRRLCLLLHHGLGPSGNHLLCLAGRRPGKRTPRLVYYEANGKRRTIAARITRPSPNRLKARFVPGAVGLEYRQLRWRVISTWRPSGCAAPTGNSISSCETVVKTTRKRLRLHVPMPVRCVATGSPLVDSGPSNRRQIALTFDDGPDNAPPTMDFVNLLHQMNVPATFFEIGRQIPTYDPTGKVERKMLAYGDMIGNHTWNHPYMPSLSASQQHSELAMTSEAIHKATGFTPCLFRAPYGAVDSRVLNVAQSLGLSTIGWDIDPRDWSLPGTGAIVQNVIDNAHNGAIVLQHNGGGSRYETFAALPQEINTLRARGYEFVTVTKLLGYKVIYR